MTDLDDALESSAPVFAPPTLTAAWDSLPPGEDGSGNLDSLRMLTGQIGEGGFSVEHSLEDGLPDEVTMTTSSDASGKLSVSLTGREALWADTIAWRTSSARGSGTGTSFTATTPSDSSWGDYSVIAIALNSSAVTVSDADEDPDVLYGWTLLGTQDDGSLKVWVWGREWYAGQPGLNVLLSASASYSWVAGSLSARTLDGRHYVPVRPGTFASWNQVTNTNSHPSPTAVLDRRGFFVGIWARVAATEEWTPGAGTTQINEQADVVDVMMSTTALRDAGSGSLGGATTTNLTSQAVMCNLPLRIMDRASMNARRYFSPLNTDSPLYGIPRDTARVELEYNVVTASGIIGTPLFSGQMEDVKLSSGGLAEMPAVSQTRLNLNATNPLPVITRRREGCTIDTLATWLMSRGGSYAGPAPSENTLFWAPFYDSVHAFMDGNLSYGSCLRYVTGSGGPFGVQPPTEVEGPFVGAMSAFSNTTMTDMVVVTGARVRSTQVPGKQGLFHDFLSQQNSKGRLTFWVRGDSASENPEIATLDPNRNFLMGWRLNQSHPTQLNVGGITVEIQYDRKVRVSMGQQSGYGILAFTGSEIPTDGAWHFVGVAWDWSAGLVRAQVDGWTNSASGYVTDDTILRATDQTLYDEGGWFFNQVYSRLPISDAQLETGPECWSGVAFGDFTRFWPTATDVNAVYRRSAIPLEAVASSTPVSAWDTLAELARNYLISYRCDEEDRFNWLPMEYFGEDDQMTSTGVADTMVNAGELNVTQDSTKIRNVVTLNFQETRVDTSRQPIVSITSAIEVPRGTTVMTFSTDVPNGEVHGAGQPNLHPGPLDFTLLTGTQIASPTTIPADNYLTVNTADDGSGSYLTTVAFTGLIIGYDSNTVTVRLTNKTTKTVYLANDGQEVPFVRILGYAARTVEAYTTFRDPESVRKRGERALAAHSRWIQTRTVAEEVVGKLINITSAPRPEMTMVVMGDPRRKPGQLVTVNDSHETAASGTWRILYVSHDGDGPEYSNTLRLVRIDPDFIWGALPGWGESVWG